MTKYIKLTDYTIENPYEDTIKIKNNGPFITLKNGDINVNIEIENMRFRYVDFDLTTFFNDDVLTRFTYLNQTTIPRYICKVKFRVKRVNCATQNLYHDRVYSFDNS